VTELIPKENQLNKLEDYYQLHKAYSDLAIEKTNDLKQTANALKSLSMHWVQSTDHRLSKEQTDLYLRLLGKLDNVSSTFEDISLQFTLLTNESKEILRLLRNSSIDSLLLDWAFLLDNSQRLISEYFSLSRSVRNGVRAIACVPFGGVSIGAEYRKELLSQTLAICQTAEKACANSNQVSSQNTALNILLHKLHGDGFDYQPKAI